MTKQSIDLEKVKKRSNNTLSLIVPQAGNVRVAPLEVQFAVCCSIVSSERSLFLSRHTHCAQLQIYANF